MLNYSIVCGGKMASFCDGLSQSFYLEDLSGFEYGAIFVPLLTTNVVTYSEDGVIGLWRPNM